MGCVHDFHKCEDLGHRPDGVPLPPTAPPVGLNELRERHRQSDGLHCLCRGLVDAAERRVAEEKEQSEGWHDAYERRCSDYLALQEELIAAFASLAAAARENERQTKHNMRLGQRLWIMADIYHTTARHDEPLESCSYVVCANNREALAAETRDTSHLEPIPGKPGGFTNKNYRRPAAEPREPEGE